MALLCNIIQELLLMLSLLESADAMLNLNEEVWRAHDFSEYRYQYTNRMNFTNAHRTCEVWNGRLVVIETNSERDFVFDNLIPGFPSWIGYTRIGGIDCIGDLCDRTTNWFWTDQQASEAVLNWLINEPGNGDRCAQIYKDTNQDRWLTAHGCFQSQSFVCERQLADTGCSSPPCPTLAGAAGTVQPRTGDDGDGGSDGDTGLGTWPLVGIGLGVAAVVGIAAVAIFKTQQARSHSTQYIVEQPPRMMMMGSNPNSILSLASQYSRSKRT